MSQSSLSELSPVQRGFLIRLVLFLGTLFGGLILGLIAQGLMGGIENETDMNVFSWISMFSGVAFSIAAPVMAIVTLRYGRKHEAEIREHRGFSITLTVYRILFWLWLAALILLGIGIFWLGTHIGPVR